MTSRLSCRLRSLRGLLALFCLLAGSAASHGAALFFRDSFGNSIGSALPGDVIYGYASVTGGATSVSGGTTGVNTFQLGANQANPLHSVLQNDGSFVQFQIPFGTPSGSTVVTFYASGFPVASGNFNILNSISPVFTSPESAEGTNGVAFEYVITAINNPTNITSGTLPTGLALVEEGSVVSIAGTPDTDGEFEVLLSAKGEHPTTSMAILTLIIHPRPPTITSSLGVLGTNGMTFNYQIETDHPATNYTAANLTIPGLSLNAETGLISGTPTVNGTFMITIGAENGPWSDSKTLTLVLDPPAPAITSELTATGRKGDQFTYAITANNNPTSYSATPLPPGLTFSPPNVIGGIPTSPGDYEITLSAVNDGGVGEATLELTVLPRAPIIDSSPSARGTNGMIFAHQITALNEPASFTADDRPGWMTLDSVTGELGGTPTAPGQFTVSLTANNLGGTGAQTLTVTIAPAVPVITSATTATATRGSQFSFQVAADNDPTGFTASPLPAGLAFNQQTGVISGLATSLGTTVVNLTASNETGTGEGTVSITVIDPAPVITSASTASGRRDVDFSHQITADNNPTGFGVTGTLPPGVTLNPATGLISGRPTAAGVYTVTLQAANSGGSGEASLEITILEKAPVITSATTASATSGLLFTYQIEANNNPTGFALNTTQDWLTVDPITGQVTGTPPQVPTSLTFPIGLIASNAGGQGTATLNLTVTPAAPVISSPGNAHGAVGSAFAYQITASNNPDNYFISGFPAGFSVNADTGLITASPTAETSFSGQVFASNGGGADSTTLTVTIHRAVPEITSPLTATGTAGVPFSYQITATQQPDFFEAQSVPGLSADPDTGLISGTPTEAGEFMIHIAAGHQGGSGEATLTLQFAAPAITSSLDVTATVGSAFSHQIVAEHMASQFSAHGLPLDLQIQAANGLIEGLPQKAGIFEIPLTASDGNLVAEATLRLTVWGDGGKPPVGLLPASGGQVRVLWPAAATGYVLQSTTSLTPPVVWSDVTETPGDNGSAKELLLGAAGAGDGKYYRLVKP